MENNMLHYATTRLLRGGAVYCRGKAADKNSGGVRVIKTALKQIDMGCA